MNKTNTTNKTNKTESKQMFDDHLEKKKSFFSFDKLDKSFIIEVIGNIIKILIGSLTFIAGLSWNNYFLQFEFAQDSILYPIIVSFLTSVFIIILNYFNLN